VGVAGNGSSVRLLSTELSWNRANGRGGGLVALAGGTAALVKCNLTANRGGKGGGVALIAEEVRLLESLFTDNIADQYGGGILAENGTTLQMNETIFRGNVAGSGGAVGALEDAVVTVRSCSFEANKASSLGGAMYCASRSVATVLASNFTQNVAQSMGSSLYIGSGAQASLASAIVLSERGKSAIAGSGRAQLSSVAINDPGGHLSYLVFYQGSHLVIDRSRLATAGSGQAVYSSSAVLVRNTPVLCDGAGGATACLASAVLAGCSEGANYGPPCGANAICSAAASSGVTCTCPPTWLSEDPVLYPCVLPPSLLYAIPAEMQASAVKPGNVTAVYTFLNGGRVALSYYTNTTDARNSTGRFAWDPPTSAVKRAVISPCSYQLVRLVVPTRGAQARDGYEASFIITSNSVGGSARVALQYDVRAVASPEQSRVMPRDVPVAGSPYRLDLVPYDPEGKVVLNSEALLQAVSATVTLERFDSDGECGVAYKGWPTRSAACFRLSAQGRRRSRRSSEVSRSPMAPSTSQWRARSSTASAPTP
jgi:hypothetical protein